MATRRDFNAGALASLSLLALSCRTRADGLGRQAFAPSDGLEAPPAMFTPADTPTLPASMVSTTPFRSVLYPTQLGGQPVLGLAGELRGFYRANRWNPKMSRFMGVRPAGLLHKGVDIYAPRGTALVAMIAGSLQQVSAGDGNAMGNRVHLLFRHANLDFRFIIGHLDRFEGAERSVNKGDVIGYAGCSGNAAGEQPCLSPNSCGKYSTHLHLQLRRDIDGKLLDPLKALGWVLAYKDDVRDVPCEQAGR